MKVFTTGQVAKKCKVGRGMVVQWFDSGRLRGYRVPGSKNRRIPREYLIRFLKEHGMPLGDLEDEAMARVLIVSQDVAMTDALRQELPFERSFRVSVVADAFSAGIEVEILRPDCVIVDFAIGKTEALMICQNLRRNPAFSDVIVVALIPACENRARIDLSSVNESFKKPFDLGLFAERLKTLIGAKKWLMGCEWP